MRSLKEIVVCCYVIDDKMLPFLVVNTNCTTFQISIVPHQEIMIKSRKRQNLSPRNHCSNYFLEKDFDTTYGGR